MFLHRPRCSSFILYLFGVLSGITVYSLFSVRIARPNGASSRNLPIVFVGGYPRSGTTLMRVLLDAHPSFHCGQETHIIPDLLTLRRKYSHGHGRNRLKEADLDLDLINTTIADSILDIVKNHGPPSLRLCSKDPFTLRHIPYLLLMFPNAQFILMVRDVRGVVRSVRKNNIKISNFPKTDREALQRWNKVVGGMFYDCLNAGPKRCIIVHYESLVLEPRFWLEKILRFLGAEWSDSVLKHTQFLGVFGGISLSRLEKSTNQVRKPIYNDSLYSWFETPLDISPKELALLAPVMDSLGYIDAGQPPQYSELKRKKFLYQ